jgi:tripartite ATP-independent transporter DctM subunit
MAAIYIVVTLNPSLAPDGPKTCFKEKISSFIGILETLFLFFIVMGGIFFGIFTPTEAAAIGAFATLSMAIVRRQISWRGFIKALAETTRTSCMVMVIIAGATIFGHFMAVTRVPFELSAWAGNLPLPGSLIMIIIILMYILGGCFMDAFAMITLTVPIVAPLAETLGFDLIWFGVIIVLIGEMGVITPPVGINVYVVHGIAKDVPLETIFRGVVPLLAALIVCNILLLLFPEIALFLPNLMQ